MLASRGASVQGGLYSEVIYFINARTNFSLYHSSEPSQDRGILGTEWSIQPNEGTTVLGEGSGSLLQKQRV